MRVQIPVRRLPVVAAIGLAVVAGEANAATVEPLLDTSVINRVHQLVPLGPAGATIALNAESTEVVDDPADVAMPASTSGSCRPATASTRSCATSACCGASTPSSAA